MNNSKLFKSFSIVALTAGLLVVGQAHAMMDDKDADTAILPISGDNTAIMDIQSEEHIDQLPQGIIATGLYMWEHREYVYPWILARRNYKNGKEKVAQGGIVDPEEEIEEIKACAPAEDFGAYKTAIDTGVHQFARKHNLDEQDTTNLLKFTLSTKGSSLLLINSIQAVEERNVNWIKTLLEGMRIKKEPEEASNK